MGFRLVLMRHGETAWTREHRFTGWTDVPLSETGRRQCEAASRALAAVPLQAVYASPLQRARASAEIIAEPHRLEVLIDARFQEIRLGQWEGLAHAEVADRFPDSWAVWRATPQHFSAPGGETIAAVAQRIASGLSALRAAHDGQTIAVVAHGIVNRLIVTQALGLGLERLWSVGASPAGVTEVEYQDGRTVVHDINAVTHLDPSPPTPV